MVDCCFEHEIKTDTAFFRLKASEVSGLSKLFKILGDETRTRIVHLLSITELCTCDLARVLNLTLPTISHHLKLLKEMRLVRSRREGKVVYYALADEHILILVKTAREHFEEVSR
ncbi:MAG TPA: metalloregulator ArsR/SmtB family transcription factor [Mesotoga infera]|jgi:ArsR family transcriptional regulator|nr:winged helix-turn-helix transcriptional regulator [Mesotoga sp.]NLI06299.1 winged helix-turn-helix transcriptional regulator [Thermotogaceae bacterium]HNR80362.1 metalloregulator ArsR/SmtB family transcription factor [Mesotoga infera]HNS65979.1 metalloregulator ArsR/SmtB family transcription factor [Mesotoga infera]HON27486.1 metalloregulator ArsR/SmtB family transcription factor [Mesotoga infera]